MGRLVDLTAQRFGHWTSLRRAGCSDGGVAMWHCRCVCGVVRAVTSTSLRAGRSTSCGCQAQIARRAPDGVSGLKALYTRYRNSAKRKQLPFKLDLTTFERLTSARCHYCDGAPYLTITFNAKAYSTYTFNGLDRKDNRKGYTAANCVACCADCNSCKGARSYTDFLALITRIANHRLQGQLT